MLSNARGCVFEDAGGAPPHVKLFPTTEVPGPVTI